MSRQLNNLEAFSCNVYLIQVLNPQLFTKGIKTHVYLHCTYVDIDTIYTIKSPRQPPTVFAYCKLSNNGWWQEPRNEASYTEHFLQQVIFTNHNTTMVKPSCALR